MEINDVLSIICLSIPVLIIIGIIILLILFFIVRNLIRKTRRKAGIPKGTGKVIRRQLANLDQYVQNDPRQVQQWQRSAPTREPVLDLDDIDVDDLPEKPSSSDKSDQSGSVMPNWSNDSLTCPACGAPQQPQHRVCSFCGHQHG
jgi:hypothetical protein